jgi:hypothetical protein
MALKDWNMEANEETGQRRAMKQICNMAQGWKSSCHHKTEHEHIPECDDPCPYLEHPVKCAKYLGV